jgi:ATP-binding cassette subfamily E protein 1
MLGENGTGKTTFIRMMHGSLKPDQEDADLPEFRVSYKPQKISPKFPGSVRLAWAPPSNLICLFSHH